MREALRGRTGGGGHGGRPGTGGGTPRGHGVESPSRVALGYAPGGTADESGTYTVTMRQLHAWAEVWLDGIGWVGVDVTPAATDEGADADATQPQESETTTPEEEATPEEPADEPAETDQGETDGAAAGDNGTAPAAGADAGATAPWLVVAALAAAALAMAAGLLARHGRPAASWQGLWRRVCRAARRAHLRWGPELTEGEVADLICARLGDERLADAVRSIARNACLERYGR